MACVYTSCVNRKNFCAQKTKTETKAKICVCLPKLRVSLGSIKNRRQVSPGGVRLGGDLLEAAKRQKAPIW